jgi:uncharacterized protein (TIGR03000 family)
MVGQRSALLSWMLAATAVVWSAGRAAAQGHAGGPGHAVAGVRGEPFRCFRPGFRGPCGYGWCGVGCGVGFCYPWWYGYPYYPDAFPVYVDVPPPAPPVVVPPACPVPAATPAGVAQTGATAEPAPPPPGTPVRLTDGDVLLSIRVPPDATVRINGVQTSQRGPRREFISSGLAPGRTYTFVVTASWNDPGGQTVNREQRISVQGGERRNVNFMN